ncbi:assembly protein [Photobacterium sp. SDRW27]|uniref:zonular occludens toxin domain-containing protein n=1 Tax=Photobacterium obscurum TaxID=2829490 RepID=UPI002243C695|nr:zonular occludens toxin domain-containing protein [Photobacterium obscurum]MCW8329400.1 assembly protein [Photobacterium obscurum]
MINLIIGRPGGGKSYEAVVYHIIPAIKSGRKVVTNLPLNVDHFVKVFGEEVRELIVIIDSKLDDFGNVNRPFSKPDDYRDEWKNEKGQGVLVVVDEAHMVLPTSGASREVLEFLSLHRHYGIDIILITQSDRKINKDVRDMVQLQYRCSKNTALGSDKSYTQKVQDGCRGEVVNTNQRRYNKSYFPFYQSHTASNTAVKEATASDVKPIWQHWSIIGSVILLGGVLIFVLSGGVKNPLSVKEPVEQKRVAVEKPVDDNSPGQQKAVVPAMPKQHPLSDFVLYVTGHSRQLAIKSDNTFDLDLSFDRVYLEAYQNNLKQFALNSDDLRKLGYKITQKADCMYSLEYEGYDSLVVCNNSREIEIESPMSFISI